MLEEAKPQTTLRDTIAEAFDEHAELPEGSEPTVQTGLAAPAPETPLAPGEKIDDRPRDEHGKFIKAEEPKLDEKAAAPLEPEVKRPPRPSSWKKDYWEHWDKLDPKLAEYLNQRESEFAKGVSTYKTEWERAKPILDSLAPHMPLYQQYGIDPAKQVGKYAEIHKTLALGTPEQKLNTFLQMAQDYQVPVQNLFTRGQDGQIYFNQQAAQPPAQAPQPQVDVASLVETKFTQYLAQQQARDFELAKDATGNPAHPHFDVVRDTMAQLLEAGLAEDIPSAYEAALRHPRHAEIFESDQQQRREKDETERQRKAQDEATRARKKAVSPRSATPAGNTTGSPKGLRAQLEAAVEEHTAGRV